MSIGPYFLSIGFYPPESIQKRRERNLRQEFSGMILHQPFEG